MFLATCFDHVFAVDGSKIAIEDCQARSLDQGIVNIDFVHSLIDDSGLLQTLQNKLKSINVSSPVQIYSRFFLHSLEEEDEDKVIALISELLEGVDGSIYLEFRTTEDEFLSKYTGSHFRRYINPTTLIDKFSAYNFDVSYSAEGVGFAKHKVDDAYVARLVLNKS